MEKLKFLVSLIILLRTIEARKICYEVPDKEVSKTQVAVKNPQDDEIDLGDMTLSKTQYDALFSDKAFKRHGLTKAFRHWDNGLVPVKFDPEADFKPQFLQRVKDAMRYIEGVSCIKFDWKTPPTSNYVFVTRAKRCSSNVGNMRHGPQNMYLYESCSKGNIIHEFLHALGFLHMHTAVERDRYVDIDWDNIKTKSKLNFKKYTSHVSMFGTEYDYNSIMHYGKTSFAKDKKKPTIIQKMKATDMTMGQRKKMSKGDIARLNKMYKCPAKTSVIMEISKNGQKLESEKAEKEKMIDNVLNSLNLNEMFQTTFGSKKSSSKMTQTNDLQNQVGKYKKMKQDKFGKQVIENTGKMRSRDDGLDDFEDYLGDFESNDDLSDFESNDDLSDFESNDDLSDFESNDSLDDFESNDEVSMNDNPELNDPMEDELNDE